MLSIIDSTLQEPLTTLRPRQNGHHFPNDIFDCTFLNDNVYSAIKITLEVNPEGPINNTPALVQVIAGAAQATHHY